MSPTRLLTFLLRIGWAVLPLTLGSALAAALDGRSRDVQVVGSTAAWAVWAVVLVATLVPHPASLTVVRVVAPAAMALAVWCAIEGAASVVALLGALLGALVVVAVASAAEIGVAFVNGSAYPNERRFPLRPPGAVLLGTVQAAWAVAVGAPVAGALLVAADRVVLGVVVLVVGVPAAVVAWRALHALSRRWFVFVPAGVVLHDAHALLDPVLFPRKIVDVLRLAPADTDSLDLTKGAPGLAVELVLREKVPMVLTVPGTRGGESGSSARLLFSPTRPGAVLTEAAARRLPVE